MKDFILHIYIITMIIDIVFIIIGYIKPINGGLWGVGKRKYELGLKELILIIAGIIITLIYGGFNWW